MTEARYDAVADFYTAAFDVIDDPASEALLSLLDRPPGGVSRMSRAVTGASPGNWPGGEPRRPASTSRPR